MPGLRMVAKNGETYWRSFVLGSVVVGIGMGILIAAVSLASWLG